MWTAITDRRVPSPAIVEHLDIFDDSVSKIALVELGDINRWKEIVRVNNLQPTYIIHPNELLLLPDVNSPARITISKPLLNTLEPKLVQHLDHGHVRLGRGRK